MSAAPVRDASGVGDSPGKQFYIINVRVQKELQAYGDLVECVWQFLGRRQPMILAGEYHQRTRRFCMIGMNQALCVSWRLVQQVVDGSVSFPIVLAGMFHWWAGVAGNPVLLGLDCDRSAAIDPFHALTAGAQSFMTQQVCTRRDESQPARATGNDE